MEKTQTSKVSKWSLIIAIFILLNLFINVSLSLFLVSPNYSDFCPERPFRPMLAEMTSAEQEAFYAEEMETYDQCQQEYNVARESYDQKVFIILISIGVIIFALSLLPSLNYVLSTALSLGAVLNFIIASMRYWSSADDLLRVIILGAALIVLIWLGIKKFSDN